MGTEYKRVESFYGTQTPFRFEADVYDCEVFGEVPRELNGRFYRAGPDRQYPTLDGDIIINGDGIVSMFRFENGHVDFKSRYVKTERLLRERAARRRLYGKYRNPYTDDPSTKGTARDNTGNTYGFYHHGRLFALREDSPPYELDPDTLETIGVCNFDGELAAAGMTAHPKIDPVTGEWWGFNLFSDKTYDGDMALQVIDKDGRFVRQESFRAPYPGLSHDFAVTREHIIFPIMPLTVDLDRVRAGGDFYAFDPALPSMWGIMPRNGSTSEIRWFKAPGKFSGHIMNAYTEGSKVHVDATISPGNGFRFIRDVDGNATDPMGAIATVSRLTFDLLSNGDEVEGVEPFPGAIGEMPRCDDRFQMARYRYGYMKSPQGIARLDWDTGERIVHAIPDAPGGAQEPIFVPRSPDAPEGDGFVLCVVNRHAQNVADLVILDAMKMDGPALATVRLPFNQHMSFHGMFVPD